MKCSICRRRTSTTSHFSTTRSTTLTGRKVKKLLYSGNFKVTDTDKQGNTCLHSPASFDSQKGNKLLDLFLDNDTHLPEMIEAENNQGRTPIHVASSVGNVDSVKKLLKKSKNASAIIKRPDTNGQCPLLLAIESGNCDVVKILRKHGAEVSKEAIDCAVRYQSSTGCPWHGFQEFFRLSARTSETNLR